MASHTKHNRGPTSADDINLRILSQFQCSGSPAYCNRKHVTSVSTPKHGDAIIGVQENSSNTVLGEATLAMTRSHILSPMVVVKVSGNSTHCRQPAVHPAFGSVVIETSRIPKDFVTGTVSRGHDNNIMHPEYEAIYAPLRRILPQTMRMVMTPHQEQSVRLQGRFQMFYSRLLLYLRGVLLITEKMSLALISFTCTLASLLLMKFHL